MNPEIGGDFAPARRTVASVELDGQAVLFDETTGMVHELDPVATVAWNCFDGVSTIDEIAADLSEAFGTDVSGVRVDVIVLVHGLGRRRLLANMDPSA